jgi:hypothetical protein
MDGKTAIRQIAILTIEGMQRGTTIVLRKLYRSIESAFPEACAKRGDLPNEPKFENDIRFAIRDAKDLGLIKPTEKRGVYQRA